MLRVVKLVINKFSFNLKLLAFLWLIILFNFLIIPNKAQASTCYKFGEEQVCILKIKRSAKYYWRYRVELSINNIKKPLAIYDCRQRKIINKDGSQVAFSGNGVGDNRVGNFIGKTLTK